MNNLYTKVNYSANIDYLLSVYIREYDISKANINILYKKGAISKEDYQMYYNMDKYQRQVLIGLLQQKSPEIITILKEGIIEAKQLLFSNNNIEEDQILSIKNDAVFLIDKVPKITKFDNIEFINKNVYTSFYKLNNNVELYYYFDSIHQKEQLDVKGINEKLPLHNNYFLEFLKVCFNSAQTESIEDTIDILVTFYNRYIALELDIGYYRTFDPASCYVMKPISNYSSFTIDYLGNEHKRDINISYNLNILRHLHFIFSNIHFSKKKR